MKKSYIIWIALGAILLFVWSQFNSMSKLDEGINKQWQQVEVAYQARMDKTKGLLSIVKGAADFEKSTLKEVIDARAAATSIKLSVDDLTEENLKKFQKAQDQFGQSLGRLMAVSENYPNLKAMDGFLAFQAQYEGMENRIATERIRFNEVVGDFNAKIRTFPKNILASMFGFEKRAYFQANEGAESAPDIKF
jgi:LemA protein